MPFDALVAPTRPKTLAASTRGMQHQSMEPLRLTSAIEWQSLMKA